MCIKHVVLLGRGRSAAPAIVRCSWRSEWVRVKGDGEDGPGSLSADLGRRAGPAPGCRARQRDPAVRSWGRGCRSARAPAEQWPSCRSRNVRVYVRCWALSPSKAWLRVGGGWRVGGRYRRDGVPGVLERRVGGDGHDPPQRLLDVAAVHGEVGLELRRRVLEAAWAKANARMKGGRASRRARKSGRAVVVGEVEMRSTIEEERDPALPEVRLLLWVRSAGLCREKDDRGVSDEGRRDWGCACVRAD